MKKTPPKATRKAAPRKVYVPEKPSVVVIAKSDTTHVAVALRTYAEMIHARGGEWRKVATRIRKYAVNAEIAHDA